MTDAALHRTCPASGSRPAILATHTRVPTLRPSAPRFVLRMPSGAGGTRPLTPARLLAIDPRRASYRARWHATLDGREHPTLQAWARRFVSLRGQLEEVRCLRGLARRRLARRGLAAAFGFLGAQQSAGQAAQ